MNIENIIDNFISLLVKVFYKYKFLFLIVFFALLSYVYYKSFFSAMATSQDMQWYPTTIFWNGLNPYLEYLSSKENWFLAQAPNYGHLLYILLYPLTLFEWETVKVIWALCSMLSFGLILFVFYKSNITLPFLLFITIFLVAGYPISNTIGNGQIGIVIALFVTLAWFYRKKSFLITTLSLGIVFVKYSFGLPILFGFFIAGYYKQVIVAFLINLVAISIYSVIFDISFIESFVLPFQVAMTATGIGPIDFMSLGRLLMAKNIIDFNISYFLVPLIFAIFFMLTLKNKKHLYDSDIIASTIFLSLVTFFHLGYDHVMFLIAILIMKEKVAANNKFLIIFSALTIFLWQIGRLFSIFNLNLKVAMNMGLEYTSMMSLLVSGLVILYILNKAKKNNAINPI